MRFNPLQHHRRSIRLKGYNYCLPGAYFVTICVHGRLCLFGNIVDSGMHLSPAGQAAAAAWAALPQFFVGLRLDAYVIMPNHLHGLLVIEAPINRQPRRGEAFAEIDNSSPSDSTSKCFAPADEIQPDLLGAEGAAFGHQPDRQHQAAWPNASPLRGGAAGTVPGSLGAIVQNYKAVSARRLNALRGTPGTRVWQRNYWEHVVRGAADLARLRAYIDSNPARWAEDLLNPAVAHLPADETDVSG